NRCIFCGYCVEACPTDAITHGHGFEIASFNATNLIYRKEQLLAAKPAHLGANPGFNTAEVVGGAPRGVAPGQENIVGCWLLVAGKVEEIQSSIVFARF